jgi:hypothetical protein
VNEDERRQAILDSLNAGRLPPGPPPKRVVASRGVGRVCDGCGRAIELGSIDYEVKVGSRILHLHIRCFDVWLAEFS